MADDNLSCVCFGAHKIRFENRPVPELNDPHDVRVRVAFVGVCGSDVHFWHHGGMGRAVSEENPIVMGHEAAGTVDAVGSAVTSLRVGDRVALEPGRPCRRCRACKDGHYNLCKDMRFAADPPQDGTLARYFVVPEDFAFRIPAALSLEEAVLVEPLGVAVHVNRLAAPQPGSRVLVLGAGTIGLLCAAVARAFGATVALADIKADKLSFAKTYLKGCSTFLVEMGATPQENASRFCKECNARDGPDIVLECTGAETSAQMSVYVVRTGGLYVQVGMGKPIQALPLLAACDKELTIKTSFRYGSGDYALALQLLDAGQVAVQPLISSIVPFEQAEEAWGRTLRGEGIKNLIRGVVDKE